MVFINRTNPVFLNLRAMCEVTNYLDDLNKSISSLEQKSTDNNRLSEEKMLTRHLVKEIRTLMQIVKLQQEGGEINPDHFN